MILLDRCDDLFVLKSLINEKLPSCLVTISTPIMRLDNAKANLTIQHLNNHLKQLNIVTINNNNIKGFHLAKKGLHLKARLRGV